MVRSGKRRQPSSNCGGTEAGGLRARANHQRSHLRSRHGANREGKAKPRKPRKPGRPRTPEAIRELVVQMAKENGWGLGRILGELKKLGIRKICKSTVRNILVENGFDPGRPAPSIPGQPAAGHARGAGGGRCHRARRCSLLRVAWWTAEALKPQGRTHPIIGLHRSRADRP